MRRTKRSIIYRLTPSVIEIEQIIKKFPHAEHAPRLLEISEENKIDGSIRVDKLYRFQNHKGKLSPVYIFAGEYDRGYAFVMKNSEYFYIDTDFTTVICEDKIQSFEELYQVIKSNPDSVLKYVSGQKIDELREPIATDFLLGMGSKKEVRVIKQMLDTIDTFISRKNEFTA